MTFFFLILVQPFSFDNLILVFKLLYGVLYSLGVSISFLLVAKILKEINLVGDFIFAVGQIIVTNIVIFLIDVILKYYFDNEDKSLSDKVMTIMHFQNSIIRVAILVVFYRFLVLILKSIYFEDKKNKLNFIEKNNKGLNDQNDIQEVLMGGGDDNILGVFREEKQNNEVLDVEDSGENLTNIDNVHPSKYEEVTITGLNKGEVVHFSANNFFYAKSEGHYIKIFYLSSLTNDKNKVVKSILIRSSMTLLQNKVFFKFDYIFRVHRSYFVNLNYVKSLKNYAYRQGGVLKLMIVEMSIPVGRVGISKVNEYFEKSSKSNVTIY